MTIIDPLPVNLKLDDYDSPKLKFYRTLLESINADSVFTPRQCIELAAISGGLPRTSNTPALPVCDMP